MRVQEVVLLRSYKPDIVDINKPEKKMIVDSGIYLECLWGELIEQSSPQERSQQFKKLTS
jgi:hypothetical protein